MKRRYPLNKDYKLLGHMRMPLNLNIIKIANKAVDISFYMAPIGKGLVMKKFLIPTRDQDTIQAYLIEPLNQTKKLPLICYYPGGGFLMTPTAFHKMVAAKFAKQCLARVLILKYRLAPKHLFPTALFDVIDAHHYVINHAEELQIETKKIVVSGDSAGGNLACGLTHYCRDFNLTMPLGQLLIYPGLDEANAEGSRTFFQDTPMFSGQNLAMIENLYYQNGFGELEVYSSPLKSNSFQGLPRTYIETAEFDPLRDDGIKYASKCMEANVSVTLVQTKGTPHGYDGILLAKTTKECVKSRIDWLIELFK
jgi:acetyl esterase